MNKKVMIDLLSRIIVLSVLSLALSGCGYQERQLIKNAVKLSGENRTEIEKLLEHYPAGDIRNRMARYMVAHMTGHYSYDTALIGKYRPFLHQLTALRKTEKQEHFSALDSVNEDWKRFLKHHDMQTDIYSRTISDLRTVKADSLIRDISLAVDIWEGSFWKDSMDEQIFREEILPYRKMNGPVVENWRSRFHNRYKNLLNKEYSLHQQTDTLMKLHDDLIVNGITFASFPYTCLDDYLEGRISHCETRCWFNSMLLSALGIPCAIDYVPAWGNRNGSHMWNALVCKDGTHPFEATGGKGKWKCRLVYNNVHVDEYWLKSRLPKVFRKAYASPLSRFSADDLKLFSDAPYKFLDKDVSDEYFETSDISVPVEYPKKGTLPEYAYLCVFNYDRWVPIFWGKREGQEVRFRKMGRDIVYLPVFYRNGRLVPFHSPFLLDSSGRMHFLKADTARTVRVRLHRKYYERPDVTWWRRWNEGAVIEAADNPSFRNARAVFRIPSCQSYPNRWELPHPVKTRFVRYVFPEHKDVLAELGFHSEKDTLDFKHILPDERMRKEAGKTSDGNILTYADMNRFAPDSVWIGFDFGEKKELTAVSLCPRNDDNNVVKGRPYELFYWDGEWVSLGIKTAEDYHVTYGNAPDNALFMLKCTLGGRENRIFTWKDNREQWW